MESYAIIRLNQDFALVKKNFPNAVQISQYDFQITFPASSATQLNLEFKVIASKNYPEEAPVVFRGAEKISLPILDYWCPAFQLYYIFEQIKTIADQNPYLQVSLDLNQIRQTLHTAGYQNITDPEKRKIIIQETRTYKDALAKANAAKIEINSNPSTFDEDELESSLRHVQQLFSVKSKLEAEKNSQNNQAPQREAEGKRLKIEELHKEENDCENQINQIKSQCFNEHSISPDECFSKILEISSKQLYLRSLASQIEALQ